MEHNKKCMGRTEESPHGMQVKRRNHVYPDEKEFYFGKMAKYWDLPVIETILAW